MAYYIVYESELVGPLTLVSDGEALQACWFDNDRYFGAADLLAMERRDDVPVFIQAFAWLDRYFAGENPDPNELPLKPQGTAFQMSVWSKLATIAYGQTTTYGALAQRIAAEQGKAAMSSRAVGVAVGRNPICIIVPCHRVMGAGGNLTGFGGGIDKKVALLKHEHAWQDDFHEPKK